MRHYITDQRGTVTGFVISPIVTSILAGCVVALLEINDFGHKENNIGRYISLAGVVSIYAAMVTYVCLGVFGLTLHAVLTRCKYHNPFIYCGVAGIIPVCLFGDFFGYRTGLWSVVGLFSFLAIVCAWVFWFFAVYRVTKRAPRENTAPTS
ncbi:hypothetical protein QFX18_05615 [Saccharophagus degradans]|uniref:hypothetical protein n=1 Tax=Saccharophagus degradans TaxID=86304 RepID=UPI002477D8E0|nr:hypothetical protein [Saccharophagus degradans]WGO99538.1 hypothetical protein QFX18_05615 [Saccharophagus degradans]